MTGVGTSPSDVMNSTDFCQPPVSIAPRSVPPGPCHASIVAARIAAWRSRSWPSVGSTLIAASTPYDGSAMMSTMARSEARTNAATASCLAAIVAVDAISPGPGSGVTSST